MVMARVHGYGQGLPCSGMVTVKVGDNVRSRLYTAIVQRLVSMATLASRPQNIKLFWTLPTASCGLFSWRQLVETSTPSVGVKTDGVNDDEMVEVTAVVTTETLTHMQIVCI